MNFLEGEWKRYRKGLIALAGAILTVLNTLWSNNPQVQAIIAVATAFGVYSVPNEPVARV